MTQTCPTKYIYLDVVGFTKNRSVEAQSDVVEILNQSVINTLNNHQVAVKRRILIPTGDGICIALLDISIFDVHVSIALGLLNEIQSHNNKCEDKSRKFSIRIGINENIDNIIIDINRRRNLAGSGINLAQRVMSLADGGQVLVSQPVYEILRNREKYIDMFRHFQAVDKHGSSFSVHQMFNESTPGLNSELPQVFKAKQQAPRKLSRLEAYYLAHALHKRAFVQEVADDIAYGHSLIIMFYFMAEDSLSRFGATEFDPPLIKTYKGAELPVKKLYEYYENNDIWAMSFLKDFIIEDFLSPFEACFEGRGFRKLWAVPSAHGVQELKQGFPDIYEAFDLQLIVG